MADDVNKTLEAMRDDELIQALRECVEHEKYVSGDFTEMMKSIVANYEDSLSNKQRNAVVGHLKFNKRLWW